MAAITRTAEVRIPKPLGPEQFGGAYFGVGAKPVNGLVLVGLFSQDGRPLVAWPYTLEQAREAVNNLSAAIFGATLSVDGIPGRFEKMAVVHFRLVDEET